MSGHGNPCKHSPVDFRLVKRYVPYPSSFRASRTIWLV